jgi:putative membrane protein
MTRWGIAMLIVATAACGGSDDRADNEGNAEVTPDAAAAPAPAATPTMPDAEIAHVASTANTLDAEGGNTAQDKAVSPEVKQFAQTMVTDHTASNKEASELAQRLNLTPSENPASQGLKQDHERAKAELATKTGADFDRAYIAHEVTMHQNVLTSLESTLIPAAQNSELKALLEKARGMVQSHLQMAQQIQTKLGGG